jgi:hypothetical protein
MAFKMKRKGFPMNSPSKNYKNPRDYRVFNMGNEADPPLDMGYDHKGPKMHGKHKGPKMYKNSPTDMEKTPAYMKKEGEKPRPRKVPPRPEPDMPTQPRGPKMKAPTKHIKGTTQHHMMQHKFDGDHQDFKRPSAKPAGPKMKSSGFKMKEGSPFQRNFGIGSPAKVAKPDYIDLDGDGNTTESMKKAAADKKSPIEMNSPVKKLGIYPVDADGMILDNLSSAEAKEHIKRGGKVIKTSSDAVESNKVELEKDIAEGNIVPADPEVYSDEGINTVDGKIMTTQADFPGDVIRTSEQIADASYDAEGGYMDKYKDYLGEDLVKKEKEIQDFVNTNPGKELPENLQAAQAEIKGKIQNMYDATAGETQYNVQNDMGGIFNRGFGELAEGVTDPNYISKTTGTRELAEGEDPIEGQDRIFEVGVQEGKEEFGPQYTDTYSQKEYKDIEVPAGEGIVGSQAAGTEKQKEETRLANIAQIEKLQDKLSTVEEISPGRFMDSESKMTLQPDIVQGWKDELASLQKSPTQMKDEGFTKEVKQKFHKVPSLGLKPIDTKPAMEAAEGRHMINMEKRKRERMMKLAKENPEMFYENFGISPSEYLSSLPYG